MEPDPRLVAALRAAIGGDFAVIDCRDGMAVKMRSSEFAAVILPAFLADPRVAEWLAERLHAAQGHTGLPQLCANDAAAILGRQP